MAWHEGRPAPQRGRALPSSLRATFWIDILGWHGGAVEDTSRVLADAV
jgi:hypothetical protein